MSDPAERCNDCGLPRREHHHDGTAYGVCGQFSEVGHRPSSPGSAPAQLLFDINRAAHAAGTNAWVRDVLKRAFNYLSREAAQRPFYGAECPSYPDCSGGCGLGCTKEVERSRGAAQASGEPVAWRVTSLDGSIVLFPHKPTFGFPEHRVEPLYAVPPSPVAGEWQSIETAPRDETRILLFQRGRGSFEGWWKLDWPLAEYWMDDGDTEPEPTHWQPLLPEPLSSVSSTTRDTP